MHSNRSLLFSALAAVGLPMALSLLQVPAQATPPVATPRRVICVSAGNDTFQSGAEGYYRSLPAKQQADVVRVGGALVDCLSQVRKGDQLVVIAHGAGGTFLWDDAKGGAAPVQYSGYGAGTGAPGAPAPVPPNLAGTNHVTVRLVGCYSQCDPAGPVTSVTRSLLAAMDGGNVNTGNTCTGFQNAVNANIGYRVDNATTDEQLAAAFAHLENNPGWSNRPPVNRQPPAADNQQTAAQAQLDAAFPGKNLQVTIEYGAPTEKASLPVGEAVAGPGTCGGSPDCGGVEYHGSGSAGGQVPALGPWAAAALAQGMLAFGAAAILVARRRGGGRSAAR